MSTVNYDLKSKGVRLISAEKAWVKGKNGKYRLNPSYRFIGKIDTHMSNLVLSTADKSKPSDKGDVSDLNRTAKTQIVNHFYDENGKRNRKTVAYFGIPKEDKNKAR